MDADPCEQNNIAGTEPGVLAKLQARLAEYAATAVDSNFASLEGDAACGNASSDPQLFNNT